MKASDNLNSSAVVFDGTVVRKEASLGEPEVALMQQAHLLSVCSGRFYVPKVLDYDAATRRMALEYLPGMIPLRSCFREGRRGQEMLCGAGEALACCHNHLRLAASHRVCAPSPWDGAAGEQGAVHGDFNLANLFYEPGRKRLVILDWQTSPALPFRCNWGGRYLDPAQFIRSLLLQQEPGNGGLVRFCRSVHMFLDAYRMAGGAELDPGTLRGWVQRYNWAVLKKQWKRGRYRSGVQSLIGSLVFPAAVRRGRDLRFPVNG